MKTDTVRIALSEDWPPTQRMLEFYQHDLSDIWDDQDLDCTASTVSPPTGAFLTSAGNATLMT